MSADTMSDREKQEARGSVWAFCTKHRRGFKALYIDWLKQPGHGCPECVAAASKEAKR